MDSKLTRSKLFAIAQSVLYLAILGIAGIIAGYALVVGSSYIPWIQVALVTFLRPIIEPLTVAILSVYLSRHLRGVFINNETLRAALLAGFGILMQLLLLIVILVPKTEMFLPLLAANLQKSALAAFIAYLLAYYTSSTNKKSDGEISHI